MAKPNLFAVSSQSGEIIDLKTADHTEARHKVINSLDQSESWCIIDGEERYIVEIFHEHFMAVTDVLAVNMTKRYWWTSNETNKKARTEAHRVCDGLNTVCQLSVSQVFNRREANRKPYFSTKTT